MLKTLILILSLTVVALPAAAQVDDVRGRIIQQLHDEGFTEIHVSKTWLGRLRFEAFSETARREIVVNPSTGVILRDYLQMLVAQGISGQGGSGDESGSSSNGTEGGSGSGGGSGVGGGGSGGGSGGSGGGGGGNGGGGGGGNNN